MSVTGFYPVLMSEDVAAAASFYRDHLGFETTFDSDWYVSLRLAGFELALLASDHKTIPASFRRAVTGGILLNLEVEDVDAVHARLVGERGLVEHLSLRSEDFGQRHFIIEAPDDVLLDVIQPIEPSAEFAAQFAD